MLFAKMYCQVTSDTSFKWNILIEKKQRKILLNNAYKRKKKKLYGALSPRTVFGLSPLKPHNLLALIIEFSFLKIKKSRTLKS